MNMDYIIREYKNGDGEQIVPLINRTWRKAYAHIFPVEVFDERDRTANERIASYDDGLKKRGGTAYVAESDGKIVGVMVYGLKSDVQEFAKEGYAQLAVLYIDEKMQRQGVGRALFNTLVDNLKKTDIQKFCIGVLKDNHNGRKAYEKWGGKLTDVQTDFVKLDVPYIEVYYEYDVNLL